MPHVGLTHFNPGPGSIPSGKIPMTYQGRCLRFPSSTPHGRIFKEYASDEEALHDMKLKIRASAYTQHGVDVRKLFRLLDRDRDGKVNFDEFSAAIRRGRITEWRLDADELRSIFNLIDKDESGSINLEELVDFIGDDERGSGTTAKHGRRSTMALKGSCSFTEDKLKEMKFHLRAAAYTINGLDLHHLFRYLDRDKGGYLSFDEFSRGIRRGRVTKECLGDKEMKKLFDLVDVDGNGQVDMEVREAQETN